MFWLASICRLNYVEPHTPLDFIKAPKDGKDRETLTKLLSKKSFTFTLLPRENSIVVILNYGVNGFSQDCMSGTKGLSFLRGSVRK